MDRRPSPTFNYKQDTLRVDISGGSFWGGYPGPSGGGYSPSITAFDSSRVDISGGNDFGSGLAACMTSTTVLHGYDFQAADGLSLVEFDVISGVSQYEVLGTGTLSGTWFDGTAWALTIQDHDSGATILAIPEPATLAMLGFGATSLLARRRNR